MRQAMSLEEEKQRLLEQFENSRAVYRRMLTGSDTNAYEEELTPSPYSRSNWQAGGFPQSQTMQWIMRHPYLFAAGAVAIAYAGKKGVSMSRSKPSAKADKDNAELKKGIAVTTLGTSLATAAAMMLRNPAQLQAMMRAIGVAANFYKSRRHRPPQRFG